VPKVFSSVDFDEIDPTEEPDGYDRACQVCGSKPTVYRVRGWYPSGPEDLAQDIRTVHFCAEHKQAARNAAREMRRRTA
jgi:hypothetical protein